MQDLPILATVGTVASNATTRSLFSAKDRTVTDLLPYQDPQLSPARRTKDLMGRMSREEKVGQLVQADGRQDAELQVRERRVGSFLHILGDKTVELQKIAEKTGLGIPLLFGIDAIHGHGFWQGATVFPTQLALSCAWNPELLKTMGQITAKEMLCTGLQWTFSPVLCLTRDLRWGRVGETFGEDPYLIGCLAAALVQGYQGDDLAADDSVLACAKHFAGYSETVGGRDATEADLSERKLRTYFLPPFEAMVKAGCRTFMTGYQCIDGVACTVNRWLLTDVLRGEWGFEGFVVTDWNNIGRLHEQQRLYSSVQAASADALIAGNDMIMVTPAFYEGTLGHLQEGTVSDDELNLACRRVLEHKFAIGLFDHKRYPPLDKAPEVIGCAAHREPLLESALQSIVLLKNESPVGPSSARATNLLPLSNHIRKIAVLGPNADDPLAQLGDWSFGSGQADLATGGHPRELVRTVLDGINSKASARAIDVEYSAGAQVMSDDLSGVPAAAEIAASADVAVVVVGDVLDQTGEECDRYELDLTGGQMPLLKAVKATGTPLVVVLINSKPLCIAWVAENADAIVEAFNPGMDGGDAVAQILFGESNPCGKLTVSFPHSVGQQPVYYQRIPGWHGNKHTGYTDTPLFAFGYGLSYTSYEYSSVRLSTSELSLATVSSLEGNAAVLTAEVTLTNTGSREGTEIVQLYLNDLFTSLSTPEKTLIGFQRVTLQPKESQVLHFDVSRDNLSFIGRDAKPLTELGTFEVMLGSSSRNQDLQRAVFELKS